MTSLPVTFVWKTLHVADEFGEVTSIKAMVPLPRMGNLAARQFDEDQEYPLSVQQYRSMKQHRYYFASIRDGFDNLPENIAARWPTAEHLRKWLLVTLGWFDEKEFDFEGHDAAIQARRLALFIRTEDEYAMITVRPMDNGVRKVIVRRAKSQATEGPNAMSPEDFKLSSKAVLDELDHMIGVAKGTLKKEAGKHA